jgi:hypothetical protein
MPEFLMYKQDLSLICQKKKITVPTITIHFLSDSGGKRNLRTLRDSVEGAQGRVVLYELKNRYYYLNIKVA